MSPKADERRSEVRGHPSIVRRVILNTLILDALQNEVDRVKQDSEFMALLREHVERDKEILDRLAE